MDNKLAIKYAEEHSRAFAGAGKLGSIIKVWRDADNVLCIEYSSNQWYHYNETAEGLEWW